MKAQDAAGDIVPADRRKQIQEGLRQFGDLFLSRRARQAQSTVLVRNFTTNGREYLLLCGLIPVLDVWIIGKWSPRVKLTQPPALAMPANKKEDPRYTGIYRDMPGYSGMRPRRLRPMT